MCKKRYQKDYTLSTDVQTNVVHLRSNGKGIRLRIRIKLYNLVYGNVKLLNSSSNIPKIRNISEITATNKQTDKQTSRRKFQNMILI